ncbi:hypothetical protein CONPUDRAFT_139096 [Coniophora puteana RWD-64-598 SS2]|uniref:Uncharacterized protein n=1 Tax=Coniophora puteana (strain RWD-64-598) TaxID=741705 RepID=A0A5M3MHC6_CONPW|nr:uncharacterized protein CONPUDRAFT_139096 [Coniophora puteana RWD-64-598 SS2]EIW78035.1 hypothetical protein CONPUDRAFT_139096 [Coniophora puteana RWD-64-598 SS2]
MFHRSKFVLVLLVAAFIAMDIFNIVGLLPAAEHEDVYVAYVCETSNTWNYKMFVDVTRIPSIAFGILLLTLALYGYYKHAVDRKKTIGIMSVNSWMKLLLTQNIIYFVVVVGCNALVFASAYTQQTVMLSFPAVLSSLQNYILAPRLLLSFRAYHARPAHSRGSSADSAFGISTYASTEKDYPLPQPPSLGRDSRASSRVAVVTWDAMTG